MKHGPLDAASLRELIFDTLDESDDLVLVLEQSDDDASSIHIATANDAFCRVSGYNHSEIVGRRIESFAAPDADPASFANAVETARNGKSLRTELLCNRANGTPFWLGLHLMPTRKGIPQRFVVLGRDITDSLQARQQQAAIQGLLAKVFHCVQAAVAIVTDDGMIQMTNPALDELLGYQPGALVGKRAMECSSSSSRAAVIAARKRQVEDGKDFSITAPLLRADGSEILIKSTSITVQRNDLRRFRIITLVKTSDDTTPVTVHVAGKIKLVGLQEVKSALGSRWDDVAARATASAEYVIKRHCRPSDTYSRTKNGEFLICFGEGTEDEAAFRAATMAREIRRRLIGEGETESATQVTAMTASVEVPNEAGQSADMLGTIINERLDSRLAQIEAMARETLRHAAECATCELEPVRGRRSNEPIARYAQLPRDFEWRIQAAYSTLSSVERKTFDFDRLVLGVAAEQVVSDLAVGVSTPIMINVSFDVFLDRHSTARYLAACQALDPRLRERIMLIISDMPPGCPQSRVLECVTQLRSFSRSVGFELKALEIPTVDLPSFGSPIVVIRIDTLNTSNEREMVKFSKLVQYLHNHKSRVLVRQVQNSAESVAMLREFGVDLVTVRMLA